MRSKTSPSNAMKSPASRDQLINDHIGLVHHVARRLYRQLSNEASLDDLVSAGAVGLINAADAFEPSRGLAFSTFALPRIRGAMLDDLRSQDNAPRSLRRRARELNAARESVAQRTAQPGTSREIADELGVDVEAVWELDADIAAAQHVSFDAPLADSDDPGEVVWQFAADDEPIDAGIIRQETMAHVRTALEQLPPRERQALALYYFEELTQQQIAQVLGVTESRVSQLRGQAIARLRRLAGAASLALSA